MKLVCVKCQTEFRMKTAGAIVVDMFNDPPEPYEARRADVWECPICHFVVVAGFANFASAHHYESEKMQQELAFAERSGLRVDNYERPRKT